MDGPRSDTLRASICARIPGEIRGRMRVGPLATSTYVYEPLMILYALAHSWDIDRWNEYVRGRQLQVTGKALEAGCLPWEAKAFDGRAEQDWRQFWNANEVGGCPSIVQTLAFLPFYSICRGFPLKYIANYQTFIFQKVINWWADTGSNLCS